MIPDTTKVCPSCGDPCPAAARWCIADHDLMTGALLWKPTHFQFGDIALRHLAYPLSATIATRIEGRTA